MSNYFKNWGAIAASPADPAAPISREAIVAAAKSCIGTPFVHQGRIPGVRLDCSGHVLYSNTVGGWRARNHDILLTNYKRRPDADEMKALVECEWDEIALDDVLPADLLLMRWLGDPTHKPRHVAIVTRIAPIYICHTHRTLERVTEHVLAESRELVLGAYRLKDLVAQES